MVDNHTDLQMQDGLARVSAADAVATARDASAAGVVQAGCDVSPRGSRRRRPRRCRCARGRAAPQRGTSAGALR
ncbi:hypothetical protein QJS66_08105 [Kocuria rhizophila]|nr:hypothetical protein QJS66_08105 [Kocuria rhizophila]